MESDTHRQTSYRVYKRVKPRGQFWLNQPHASRKFWGANYFIYDTFNEKESNAKRNQGNARAVMPQIEAGIGTVHTG